MCPSLNKKLFLYTLTLTITPSASSAIIKIKDFILKDIDVETDYIIGDVYNVSPYNFSLTYDALEVHEKSESFELSSTYNKIEELEKEIELIDEKTKGSYPYYEVHWSSTLNDIYNFSWYNGKIKITGPGQIYDYFYLYEHWTDNDEFGYWVEAVSLRNQSIIDTWLPSDTPVTSLVQYEKPITTKEYVDEKIGDIETVLDMLNGVE